MGLAQSGFHAFIASLPLAMVAVGRPDDEIGAIMGSAAVFNLMAALAAGGLIDRYGGRLVYTVGTTLLASGSLLLALGIVNADDPAPMLVLVRLLQGVGLAGVLPAVASLVPAWSLGPGCRRLWLSSAWPPTCQWQSCHPSRSPS